MTLNTKTMLSAGLNQCRAISFKNNKYWVVSLIAFLFSIEMASATTYFTRQTGSWNVNSTWSTVAFGNATNAGTFPVAGDIVNIGGTVTITVTVASACTSITFEFASNKNNININSG